MILVQVTKQGNESPLSLLRRFQKRVQEAGFIRGVKGRRFKERKQSEYKRKMHTLARLEKRKIFEKLYKLGKVNAVRKKHR